jgi:tetratricopeptide (TPR) repeat protein
MAMRTHSQLLFLVALASASVAPLTAAAGPKQEATKLFKQGNKLFTKGDYQAALEKFQQARKLYPSYRIDLNVASTLKEMGHSIEAAEAYETFLGRGGTLAPAKIVRAARASLEALQAQLGRVKLSCNENGATAKLGDQAVGQTPIARWIYLKPGSHTLEVCKEGFDCRRETLSLIAGDRKELQIELQAKPEPLPAAAVPDAPAPVTEPSTPVVTEQASPPEEKAQWKATAGWVTLGVGAASLVTGIVFGVMVKSKADEYSDGVAQNMTYTELEEIRDAGERFEKAEIATLVVGGVAMAAGGGLLLWHYLGRRERVARNLMVVPVASARMQGLAGVVRF